MHLRESFHNKRRRRNWTAVNEFLSFLLLLFFYFCTLCVFPQGANSNLGQLSIFHLFSVIQTRPDLILMHRCKNCKIKCIFRFFSQFRILFTFCFKEHHKLTSWLSVAHEPQKNDARLLNFSKSMLVATIFKTSCCAELLLFYFSSWTWSWGRPMWIILKNLLYFV